MGNFGKPALAVTDIRLEAVALPHFDDEKVVVVFFGLPARGVLGEKCFGYLLEVVESVTVVSRINPRSCLSD